MNAYETTLRVPVRVLAENPVRAAELLDRIAARLPGVVEHAAGPGALAAAGNPGYDRLPDEDGGPQ